MTISVTLPSPRRRWRSLAKWVCAFRRASRPTRAQLGSVGTSQEKKPGAVSCPRYTSISLVSLVVTTALMPVTWSGTDPSPVWRVAGQGGAETRCQDHGTRLAVALFGNYVDALLSRDDLEDSLA